MLIRLIFVSLLYTGVVATQAAPGTATVRIGTLAFGTVSWELAAMQIEGLDKRYGVELDVKSLATPEAGKIGLKAGDIDIIATDWIWVANQDQSGSDYRFVPYSTQSGAVMVAKGSKASTVADLRGKKIGIVGGPLDKNWLLLRAFAKEKYGIDLDSQAEKVFGAPPLLNQQIASGQLDAIVDFWHYATKLERQGYRRLIDGKDVVAGLGITDPMPNLGYVFKQGWAQSNTTALSKFLEASKAVRERLCSDDGAWGRIADLTQESDPGVQKTLRKEYCAGLVRRWTEEDRTSAGRIYQILRTTGGTELTGKSEHLPPEIFWPYDPKPQSFN